MAAMANALETCSGKNRPTATKRLSFEDRTGLAVEQGAVIARDNTKAGQGCVKKPDCGFEPAREELKYPARSWHKARGKLTPLLQGIIWIYSQNAAITEPPGLRQNLSGLRTGATSLQAEQEGCYYAGRLMEA